MAYTALYREWRPQNFEDLVGQKHVTVTLRNQIKSGRIAHAYLLCGTRGTGKTSTAKILAKAVNCLKLKDGEPCNECEMCLKINAGAAIDVVEMDAASHRGIDKMRDVISDVQYPPRESKYKVYIIDEVHMLTIEAVNAFLKTLEEPPANVVFILATTDPQKLPITILSRCQRYDFRRIRSGEIFDRLRVIVKDQGIYADDDSLNLIARMCDGAMRDALSVLDQSIAMSDGKVDYNQVVSMLGLVTNEGLLKLADAVIEKNIEKAMKMVDEIIFSGKDIYTFIRDFITHMRNLMMVKVSTNPEEVLDMSKENIAIVSTQAQKIRLEEIMRNIRILQEAEEQSKWSRQSRIYLELSIIKMCKIEYDTSKEVLLTRINKLENIIKEGKISIVDQRTAAAEETKSAVSQTARVTNASNKAKPPLRDKEEAEIKNYSSNLTLESVRKNWRDILELIKARRLMSLYACLITGEVVSCENGIIFINFGKDYAFSKRRLEAEENNRPIEEIFSEVLKEKVKLRYTVDSSDADNEISSRKTEDILVEKFGKDFVEIVDD
jgi:DNA polymerase-3 subunit gamma/tau